ncbi:peroxiredoxin-like family protein [Nonlabens ulvanivorans]|uniref:Alkyl hydroperoxide reductase n=1 Tax=Nonlabens ulvanivorans TaxID=906888 RepID=A0A084JUU7_NONUL|nr:peroxiredoxin-like family protein [Nonlabens ulvanivorans]KEZ92731.1 alkyl hydroperoxide reductase [Nonlabens ulvanivorans]PRX15578.1 peroxiredoxin [Nonlabens ulvanivorans]
MKPKQHTPKLEVTLIDQTKWSLESQKPNKYTLTVFYRGYHCPVCKKQLETVTDHLPDFKERGIDVIAISMDSKERAEKSSKEWNVEGLTIGYDLPVETAKEWGLYLSKAISDKEPDLFSEPAIFLIKPDKTLFFASIQTMPFARPKIADLIKSIDFVEDKHYPARGEA